MRPHGHPADGHRLSSLVTYRRSLSALRPHSVPGVHQRPDGRRERIAAYTLITTCLLSRRLGRMADLGLLIDAMIQIVGDDQLRK